MMDTVRTPLPGDPAGLGASRELDDLVAENARLKAIVARLPVTADGVRVLPEIATYYDAEGRPLRVLAAGPCLAVICWPVDNVGHFDSAYGGRLPTTAQWRELYSTRAAALGIPL